MKVGLFIPCYIDAFFPEAAEPDRPAPGAVRGRSTRIV